MQALDNYEGVGAEIDRLLPAFLNSRHASRTSQGSAFAGGPPNRENPTVRVVLMLQNADHADLRGATLNDVAGNQFNTFVFSPEEREALATLKPAAREGYDVPRCMEGTRQSVLEKIYSWLDDFSASK